MFFLKKAAKWFSCRSSEVRLWEDKQHPDSIVSPNCPSDAPSRECETRQGSWWGGGLRDTNQASQITGRHTALNR